MKKAISAGGIVLNNDKKVLVVSQGGISSWSLPKGHVKEGEDFLEAAIREIKEESGITDLKLIKPLGSYQRQGISNPEEIKKYGLFLFETDQTELEPEDPDNPKAIWVDKEEVTDLLRTNQDKDFFQSVKNQL